MSILYERCQCRDQHHARQPGRECPYCGNTGFLATGVTTQRFEFLIRNAPEKAAAMRACLLEIESADQASRDVPHLAGLARNVLDLVGR